MKVKDFKGFMNSKSLNEDEMYDGAYAGANPEEGEAEEMPDGEMNDEFADEDEEGMEEEEVTLEDLKAIVDDLTERLEALEGDDEEGEDEEMEEGEDEEMEDEEMEEGEDEEEV